MKELPDTILEDFIKYAKEGFFVTRRLYFWDCDVNCNFYKGRVKYKPSRIFNKHDLKRKLLMKRVYGLFTFYTHKTPYGFYVPKKHIEFFLKEVSELNKEIENYKIYVEENFEDISKEVRRRCAEAAQFKWANELNNEGVAPQNFIENYTNTTLTAIKRRLKRKTMQLSYMTPMINVDTSGFLNPDEINKINKQVAITLYDSVLYKRQYFLQYLSLKSKRKYSFKGICIFLRRWSFCVFYEDPGLLDRINSIRNFLMKTQHKKFEDVKALLEELMVYISSDTKYDLQKLKG